MVKLKNDLLHLNSFVEAATPRHIRPLLQFAEEEIIFPKGWLYEGEHYSTHRFPFQKTLFEWITSEKWYRFFLEAARQSSKTFPFLIATLWHLFEIRESMLIGLPNLDFAEEFWVEKLFPMIEASKYRDQLPDRGPGSRGGPVRNYIQFRNGSTLYFASEGFSKTIRVVFFTEIYRLKEGKKSKNSKAKVEAGAFYQMEQCTTAYDLSARIYGECIPTDGNDKVHKEVEGGTDSKIWMKCPHCGKHVPPLRDQFRGWQDAEDELTAAEVSRYYCNECETAWNEKDREYALDNYKILHKGQSVGKNGKIRGKEPRTMTLGLNWPRFQSGMASMAKIAIEEWRAEFADSDTDADPKQAIYNYLWGMVYKPDIELLPEMTKEIVLSRIARSLRYEVPPQTEALTVFIDVGLYTCWYTAWAWWGYMQGRCIDYGSFNVPQNVAHPRIAVKNALLEFDNNVLKNGFIRDDESIYVHDMCFVDMGYQRDAVYDFILTVDRGQTRYRATQGDGSNKNEKWSDAKARTKTKTRILGNHYYTEVQPSGIFLTHLDVDWLKTQIHNGFFAPEGADGALTLYNVKDPREHVDFGKQIAAEAPEIQKDGSIKWIVLNRRNHDLDCSAGAFGGALFCGMILSEETGPPIIHTDQPSNAQRETRPWIKKKRGGWLKR